MVTKDSKTSDFCEIYCSNEEKVSRLRHEVEVTRGIAVIFKALADDTRLKIVYALSQEELCVCDVANIIGSTVATASHHLRLLKNLGLAECRKEGKMVYYSLHDQCARDIINSALLHFRENHNSRP